MNPISLLYYRVGMYCSWHFTMWLLWFFWLVARVLLSNIWESDCELPSNVTKPNVRIHLCEMIYKESVFCLAQKNCVSCSPDSFLADGLKRAVIEPGGIFQDTYKWNSLLRKDRYKCALCYKRALFVPQELFCQGFLEEIFLLPF